LSELPLLDLTEALNTTRNLVAELMFFATPCVGTIQ